MDRILLETRQKPNETDIDVVLYYLPDSEDTPFVTWLSRRGLPETTVLGHYFKSVVQAVHDFEER